MNDDQADFLQAFASTVSLRQILFRTMFFVLFGCFFTFKAIKLFSGKGDCLK